MFRTGVYAISTIELDGLISYSKSSSRVCLIYFENYRSYNKLNTFLLVEFVSTEVVRYLEFV